MEDCYGKMRGIPAIDRLLAAVQDDSSWRRVPHKLVVAIMRQVVAGVRDRLRQGQDAEVTVAVLVEEARQRLAAIRQPSLRRVINATGVVLHTNLGRAPLGRRAIQAVEAVMNGYSSLEYNIATGERGSRYSHVVGRICALVGCEDALVVNNNAAAVLLVLSALAKAQEVIVSRGQLVEIGGSFRVPDVLKQSGATLVEVGTTNKTHLADYQAAIGPNTAAILKVHTSNYHIIGFTAQPKDTALVQLARENSIPVIEDLGSGTLLPLDICGWNEPSVTERLSAGMDVVTFSGDKLLGAGQGGIIAGKKCYIDKMKQHPLLRAIRVDKLTLAALEGTLLDYQLGNAALDIPVQRLLQINLEELKWQAESLLESLVELTSYTWQCALVPLDSQAGGGALPGVNLASYGVSIKAARLSAADLEKRLRLWEVPIIVRIQNDQVIVDVRCLAAEDRNYIVQACIVIARGDNR